MLKKTEKNPKKVRKNVLIGVGSESLSAQCIFAMASRIQQQQCFTFCFQKMLSSSTWLEMFRGFEIWFPWYQTWYQTLREHRNSPLVNPVEFETTTINLKLQPLVPGHVLRENQTILSALQMSMAEAESFMMYIFIQQFYLDFLLYFIADCCLYVQNNFILYSRMCGDSCFS